MGYNTVAIFICLAVVASQICEIPRNSTKSRTYSSSKRVCKFLLVNLNSNYKVFLTVFKILTHFTSELYGISDPPSPLSDMATSIAVTLVQSRLDYANSLLYRVSTRNIHKLQRCQNAAARLILQQSFTRSIQDLMNQLHWLPIQARIDFKIATLTYKALSSGQPAYLRELISPYKPSHQLRSSDQSLLTVPRTNLTIGQRAFSWSSVFIWNSIPLSVRKRDDSL